MIRKGRLVRVLALCLVAGIVVEALPDIARYLRMRAM